MGWDEFGARALSLPTAALLACAAASCADPPVAPERPAPQHPAAEPILADPPAACTMTGDSLTIDDDWQGTGLEVEELIPEGWDPQRHPTLIFLHGDNTAPGQYHCYRELLASCCVRSIYPRQPNTARCEMEPLGWDQRFIRWSNLVLVYSKVVEQQDESMVIIGGHSIGAYTAMLAAGARSGIRR
ncbi:MAG: hypothetical protein JRF63_13575, partial [Deltaproteobacteria bacterium]|nr:hypothetical protein [Deltaproteobacteria bacterium]